VPVVSIVRRSQKAISHTHTHFHFFDVIKEEEEEVPLCDRNSGGEERRE
jgi:hypothetical protein